MRNLKKVLFQFAVSLYLGVNTLEAGNDNLIPMRAGLHPAFKHCLIETSQGKVALLDSNQIIKATILPLFLFMATAQIKNFLTNN